MKRIVVMACVALGLAVSAGNANASWGHLTYSGYQPWWNIFAKRYKCLTPEEERLHFVLRERTVDIGICAVLQSVRGLQGQCAEWPSTGEQDQP